MLWIIIVQIRINNSMNTAIQLKKEYRKWKLDKYPEDKKINVSTNSENVTSS